MPAPDDPVFACVIARRVNRHYGFQPQPELFNVRQELSAEPQLPGFRGGRPHLRALGSALPFHAI
jgi:hypothetical protein